MNIEITEHQKQISDIINRWFVINSTLYSVCCSEEPQIRKKDDVQYYECPYCKEECDVEFMEDEFPDFLH